jgi:hypothetical protein
MHCRGLQKFKTAEGKVEKLRVGGRILRPLSTCSLKCFSNVIP